MTIHVQLYIFTSTNKIVGLRTTKINTRIFVIWRFYKQPRRVAQFVAGAPSKHNWCTGKVRSCSMSKLPRVRQTVRQTAAVGNVYTETWGDLCRQIYLRVVKVNWELVSEVLLRFRLERSLWLLLSRIFETRLEVWRVSLWKSIDLNYIQTW